MNDNLLAERFETERDRLRAVAYRLLGSAGEADDAVQEAWLRLSRTDASEVENLGSWLTTVVARVCLDMLRSRRTRREQPLAQDGEFIPDTADPEHDAVLVESVGLAMLAVLDRLEPAERVAFVLHDVFSVPHDDIADIVGRTPVATRKLASRGRQRVREASADKPARDPGRQQEIVEAFFRASRAGDFQALLSLLDPNVVLRPDETALEMGKRTGWITSELHGPEAVARQFRGQAEGAQPALLDGLPGAVWAPGGTPRVAFVFTVAGQSITGIELVADAGRLGQMNIEVSG